jgi:hypothetical protein
MLKTEPRPDDDSGRRIVHKDFTFLGVFQTDDAGAPQPDTLEMAAFASAFVSLSGSKVIAFGKYQKTMQEAFQWACEDAARTECQVDDDFVSALTSRALEELGWTPAGIDCALVIVRSPPVKDERGRTLDPKIDPVNGFFLDDLAMVLEKVSTQKGQTGLVLPYLTEADEGLRCDCTTLEALKRTLTVDRMPDGRWPAEHTLTLMQQVAVNQAVGSLTSGGIFSINGPPGTGKTTLLMDVIAALVVERAKVLCDFDKPCAAFEKEWEVKYGDLPNPAAVFRLDRRLHGFSMVVASSNNGAVENITRELPNATKLAERFRNGADSLKPLATQLLNLPIASEDSDADAEEEKQPLEAWGLISAVLGNKTNRSAFVNTLRATIEVDEPDPDRPGRKKRILAPYNVFKLLDEARRRTDWNRTRIEFKAAVDEVNRLKKEIAEVEELEVQVERLYQDVEATKEEVVRLEGRLAQIPVKRSELDAEVKLAKDAAATATQTAEDVRVGQPGFFAWLFNTSSFRQWQAEWRAAADVKKSRHAELNARQEALVRLQVEEGQINRLLVEARRESETVARKADAVEKRRGSAGGPGYVGFNDLRAMTDADRQQELPHSNDALQEARAVAFLKAMQVHLAFVTSADHLYERNLKRALDMIDGRLELGPILEEAAPHLWETLFLLVPVISTTFASFSRTFRHLGASGTGWLFVDEAGQAVPQHAVGSLYRSRRALIVGDPFQVEPVIMMDEAADRQLLDRHAAPVRYQSTATSVQVLADSVNRFGTRIKTHCGEDAWVGSPLRVHRRCVNPMFSISNALAYNGTMVLGRGKESEERDLTEGNPGKGIAPRVLLGPSIWIDISGTEGNRQHYVPAQGEMALSILRAYMANGWVGELKHKGLPAVYVISPFKSVANEFSALLRRTRTQWAPDVAKRTFDKWLKASVGTVHTFQGKEQETIVFLLGGANDGAIQWMAQSPNVLNVAVTRAQRRLYVVGDRTRWTKWELAAVMGNQVNTVPAAVFGTWLRQAGLHV